MEGLFGGRSERVILMKSYSDEELMLLVKRQCVPAFEELLDRYERRVFAFFHRMSDDPDRARDWTQETFLRIWRHRAHYVSQGRFSAYLFRIARNQFIDAQRKEQNRVTAEQQQLGESERLSLEASDERDGCQELFASELRAAIGQAIARLPEAHRLVYALSEEEHMSYRDIADVLDCPVGTVSSRKVEAVKKLRLWLKPWKDELLRQPMKPALPG
jgi:RNA polymerase sigma-70 factor, ECF subfamily